MKHIIKAHSVICRSSLRHSSCVSRRSASTLNYTIGSTGYLSHGSKSSNVTNVLREPTVCPTPATVIRPALQHLNIGQLALHISGEEDDDGT